jgi:hypothetical protein
VGVITSRRTGRVSIAFSARLLRVATYFGGFVVSRRNPPAIGNEWRTHRDEDLNGRQQVGRICCESHRRAHRMDAEDG